MYGCNLPGTKSRNLFRNPCLLCLLIYNNECGLKGDVTWHQFDLQQKKIVTKFLHFFGAAMYVDYLMFLTLIQLLTQPPCRTQP